MINKVLLILASLTSILMYSVGNIQNAIYFALMAILIQIADSTQELKKK